MFFQETEALLHKSLPDVPRMVISRSLKHDIDDLVAMVFPSGRLAVVDDDYTAQAFGDEVFRALKGRFDCIHITLEAPTANKDTVEELRRKTARCDALVAVGSGTISDLCKYASFLSAKPYIVFPTAASMNGYLSANASICVDGYKKTFAAHMPGAVLCDTLVIAAAPPHLNKSGLGDSLARSTAQADWLLSHLLLGTAYDETPFELLKPLELYLHDNARGIAKGDRQSLELLMQTLLLSGLGMTIAGGSYPASQGEHMIAHAMGMLSPSPVIRKEETFHGEEIGVTTLTMAKMQEKLLRGWPAFASPDFPAEIIEKLFGSKITEEAKKAYKIKQEKLDSYLHVNNRDWEAVAGRIEPVMIPSARIHAILKAAECPDTPGMLGWDIKTWQIAITYARFLRDRFTFLDLAQD